MRRDGSLEPAARPCTSPNTGLRAGEEVVQLYLHDVVTTVARPVHQLVGFTGSPLTLAQPPKFRSASTPTGRRSYA